LHFDRPSPSIVTSDGPEGVGLTTPLAGFYRVEREEKDEFGQGGRRGEEGTREVR